MLLYAEEEENKQIHNKRKKVKKAKPDAILNTDFDNGDHPTTEGAQENMFDDEEQP